MFEYETHGLMRSKSRLRNPGNGPQCIGDVLDQQLVRDPQRLALVGLSGRYSYAQLDQAVNSACQVLLKLRVKRYHRVAVCLPNDVDIIIIFLAVARLGAIWVGINRPLAGPEKAYILRDCGAQVYLADTAMIAEIKQEPSALLNLKHLITVEPHISLSEWHILCELEKANALEKDPNVRPAVEIDPFEPAAIAYTSGTTGFPKGAVHSHHNILLPGAIAVYNRSYGADCPQGVMLPLTILNLMVLGPMVAFQDGSCCVCMNSLAPESIASWVREEKIGHFAAVPTVIFDLLSSPTIGKEDLASLGKPDIGGAVCSEELQTLYRERFGRGVTVAYGMTEAPTIITRTDPERIPQFGLCGRAVEQLEIVIIDENDEILATGEEGEICFRPAKIGRFAGVYTPMLGYWNKPQESKNVLRNGLYHTGDIGYLNADTELTIRGRRNELIIRGGANVYPAEVERVMAEHPAISTAAVLGISDDRLGQRVVAVVELQQDAETTVADIYDFCRQRLARYKVPETIKIVQTLPRNAMNKVIKPRLIPMFEFEQI